MERECRIGGQLNLPGVVRVLDALREAPHLLIVMDLMECDLETWIGKYRVPFAQALKWALDLCDTLRQVHHEGIVHRDITPKTYCLTPKGM